MHSQTKGNGFAGVLKDATGKEKFLKKNIAKSFADSKIVLIFATAFASKTARDRIGNQGGKKPYEIKSSLKIFEQLRKFYSLLKKSNFKQYL